MFKRPCIWQDSFEDKDRSTLQLQAVQHPTLLSAMHFSFAELSHIRKEIGETFFSILCYISDAAVSCPSSLYRAWKSSVLFYTSPSSFLPTALCQAGQLLSAGQHVDLLIKCMLTSLTTRMSYLWTKRLALKMREDEEGLLPFSHCKIFVFLSVGGFYSRD